MEYKNTEALNRFIEYNTLIDLYFRNKRNHSQTDLLHNVFSKFKEVRGATIWESDENNNKKLNIYDAPENTELSELYIAQVKKTCASVGINVIVNPEYNLSSGTLVNPITKNDYVIITKPDYFNIGIEKFNEGAGTFLLLDPKNNNLKAYENILYDKGIYRKYHKENYSNKIMFSQKEYYPKPSIGVALIRDKGTKTYNELGGRYNYNFNTKFNSLSPALENNNDYNNQSITSNVEKNKLTLDSHGAVSLENLEKYIQADIMVELYHRNKNNPEKSDLVNNLTEKFKQTFDKYNDITKSSPSKVINAYVIPENTNISQIYIEKAQEICKDLGINIKINPTGEINQDDYVLFSALPAMYATPEKLKKATGVSFVLDHVEFSSNGATLALSEMNQKGKNINTVLITTVNSDTHNQIVNNPPLSTGVFPKSVPDAPHVKNAWNYGQSDYTPQQSSPVTDKIKNIRDNLTSSNNQTQQNKLDS